MGWQRRLYAKQEPSKGFRIWTTTLGIIVLVTGGVLLAYGGRMFNTGDLVVGSAMLLGSLPLLVVGLGIVLLANMRWTNPTL